MKKIFYLSLLLTLAMFSCDRSYNPAIADFTIEVTGDPEVGKEIFFINNSRNAVSYDWDFGDGYGSSDENPSYIFNSTGTFTVTLTAIGEDGDESKFEYTIDILIPTLLVIEVREWYDETVVVPGASVLLYESLQEWDEADASKALYEGFTNNNGVVVFSNLGPYRYYVDVWEENHDNWDFANPVDGILYIETPSIMTHQINWFVAWVDIVDHGKSGSRGMKDMTIKKIERKIINPTLKSSVNGTEGWKELYEQRVNK